MDNSPRLLVFGTFKRDRDRSLEIAAIEAGYALERHTERRTASAGLERAAVALVAEGAPELDRFSFDARADPERAELPILMLSERANDLTFAHALAAGLDDVVPLGSSRGLVRRLRGLRAERAQRTPGSRGHALLAEADARRRISIGRALRSAGYAVKFAVTADDATTYAAYSDFALVVVSTELVPDQRAAIEHCRTLGGRAAWIASCAPHEQRSVRAALADMSRVTVMDAYTSPDAVLFASNELMNTGATEQRRSTRALHGTTIAFRGAGRDEDEFGYSYNVSEGGMYVRSLAPPEDSLVWLELEQPNGDRRVRLVGEVVWRRAFGGQAHATVPPGFGVRITDGARADLDAYRSGCRSLIEELG